jgi:hypothetical protein
MSLKSSTLISKIQINKNNMGKIDKEKRREKDMEEERMRRRMKGGG